MITNSILSDKQVKALKDYYCDSNWQFAEGAAIVTQATVGLERIVDIGANLAERLLCTR
jgi:hypothetical protein